MLDPIHEECGIAALFRMDDGVLEAESSPRDEEEAGIRRNVVEILPDMLIDLQNRGQLAAGITRYNESAEQLIDTYKDVGSVNDVFHLTRPNPAKFQSIVEEYRGRAAIGHVRYATCGKDDPSYAQPFERHHGRKWKWFAFCFNGNIANYAEVRTNLLAKGDYHLVRETDTELLMHHLSYALQGDVKPDLVDVFKHIDRTVDGAYTLAFINADGDLVLARDRNGFRPLCFATDGNLFGAASESLALTNRGFRNVRDVEPGTLVHVRHDGFQVKRFAEASRKSFCFFEFVYFANVASRLNDKSVYLTRTRLGEALAANETIEVNPDDCVAVPVPDTSRAACDGMSYRLGIPAREGLLRNRYLGRTFIEGNNRSERARRKYTVIPEVMRGKTVFLVEDSIVRATTLKVIIKMIREQGGARKVHVRVACPPIMAPCMYGIDMSTVKELFAPRHTNLAGGEVPEEDYEKLAAVLGADSLRYLSVKDLVRAMELGKDDLCLGCLTGEYPTPAGNELYLEALRRRNDDDGRRTYERLSSKSEVAAAGSGTNGRDRSGSRGVSDREMEIETAR